MADIVSKRKRSQIMAAVRSHGNRATELKLMALIRQSGIKGWRRHQPVLGKPDFVFPKLRIAVFVDGCFWHACPKHSNLPANNRSFWRRKFTANKARDRFVTRTLRRRGWRVVRIWEHDLMRKREARLVARLHRAIVFRHFSP